MLSPEEVDGYPRASRSPREARYAWGVCGFLLLAAGLIYAQTLGHGLLMYDDADFVYDNPHVAAGLTGDGLRWAFTSGPAGEWYPLAMLSHMLDCQLFGVQPWGHHLTSALLHAATSIALFLVWWRLTGELWPSAFVATVFAVHPQHVESVAWVAERKDVLSGFFFVLTLGAYGAYVRHGRTLGRYLLVVALFVLGLLSKPMLVTVPALLLLLDFWPLARWGAVADAPRSVGGVNRPGGAWLLLEKVPLCALAAADCLMTLRTHAGGAAPLRWPLRIGNAAVSCVIYVVQFFCPVDLAAFYPLPQGGQPAWKVVCAATALLLVSAAAIVWRRRYPYGFVGWFWYLGTLCPVLGVVSIGSLAMADRYMYLPSIGLSVALVWGAARFAGDLPVRRWILGGCAGFATVILMVLAARQTTFWRNDEIMWRHALECTTDNGKAEGGLAEALRRQEKFDEAIPHFQRAIKLTTDYVPFSNFGSLLLTQNKTREAMAMFRRAIEIKPDAVQPHVNLGLALGAQKRFSEAREQFDRALEIDAGRFDVHRGLAYVLTRQGKSAEAIAELERAIAIDPHHAQARYDLAILQVKQGQLEAATRQFEAALAIDPNYGAARLNLARTLAGRHEIGPAMKQYHQLLETEPQNAEARQEFDKLRRENAF
ncbi:MAG TPA: tetratricopeptide repeat protein [Pirellulales bacterium]|nr:tetratricopeptide repeat protein [Pirellulales bacterium]